nr:glucan endo-1,3-beta-glucosidase bgn13.1 [Quercus suber]
MSSGSTVDSSMIIKDSRDQGRPEALSDLHPYSNLPTNLPLGGRSRTPQASCSIYSSALEDAVIGRLVLHSSFLVNWTGNKMTISLLHLASLLGLVASLPASPHLDSRSSSTAAQPLSRSAAVGSQSNVLARAAGASDWWYPNLDHSTGAVRDYVPNLGSDYDYPVYIAVESGDSQGLIDALISDGPNGDRDNLYLAGEPRTVYLAPGTYSLTSTLYMDTDTIIIGDASAPPTIQAASGFDGDYLIVAGQGDESDRGGELHFSVGIKNVILDTTPNAGSDNFAALSWRVAQNSLLVGVQFNLPEGAHTGTLH